MIYRPGQNIADVNFRSIDTKSIKWFRKYKLLKNFNVNVDAEANPNAEADAGGSALARPGE